MMFIVALLLIAIVFSPNDDVAFISMIGLVIMAFIFSITRLRDEDRIVLGRRDIAKQVKAEYMDYLDPDHEA